MSWIRAVKQAIADIPTSVNTVGEAIQQVKDQAQKQGAALAEQVLPPVSSILAESHRQLALGAEKLQDAVDLTYTAIDSKHMTALDRQSLDGMDRGQRDGMAARLQRNTQNIDAMMGAVEAGKDVMDSSGGTYLAKLELTMLGIEDPEARKGTQHMSAEQVAKLKANMAREDAIGGGVMTGADAYVGTVNVIRQGADYVPVLGDVAGAGLDLGVVVGGGNQGIGPQFQGGEIHKFGEAALVGDTEGMKDHALGAGGQAMSAVTAFTGAGALGSAGKGVQAAGTVASHVVVEDGAIGVKYGAGKVTVGVDDDKKLSVTAAVGVKGAEIGVTTNFEDVKATASTGVGSAKAQVGVESKLNDLADAKATAHLGNKKLGIGIEAGTDGQVGASGNYGSTKASTAVGSEGVKLGTEIAGVKTSVKVGDDVTVGVKGFGAKGNVTVGKESTTVAVSGGGVESTAVVEKGKATVAVKGVGTEVNATVGVKSPPQAEVSVAGVNVKQATTKAKEVVASAKDGSLDMGALLKGENFSGLKGVQAQNVSVQVATTASPNAPNTKGAPGKGSALC